MPRSFDARRVKIHRNYTISEAADLLGAHPNTVHAWLKGGLSCVKDRRPWLIVGRNLRDFLDNQHKRRRVRCPPDHLYCFRCRAAREPAGMMLDYVPVTDASGNLKGLCSVCDGWMNRRTSLAKISHVAGRCTVAFPLGRQRLIERT